MQTAESENVSPRLKLFLVAVGLAGAASPTLFGPERSMFWLAMLAALATLLPVGDRNTGRSTSNPLVLRLSGFVMFGGLAAALWLE